MTTDSLIGHLLKHNVTVGVGPRGVGPIGHPFSAEMTNSRARNLRFDLGEVREVSFLNLEAVLFSIKAAVESWYPYHPVLTELCDRQCLMRR